MVQEGFYPIRMLVLDLMWDSSKYFLRFSFWQENLHGLNDESFLGDELNDESLLGDESNDKSLFLYYYIYSFNTGLAFREYFSFRRIWVVLKRTKSTCVVWHLGSFSVDSLCQLYVFWHYHDPFSMDDTEICVFKESYEISLSCLLKCCCCCWC